MRVIGEITRAGNPGFCCWTPWPIAAPPPHARYIARLLEVAAVVRRGGDINVPYMAVLPGTGGGFAMVARSVWLSPSPSPPSGWLELLRAEKRGPLARCAGGTGHSRWFAAGIRPRSGCQGRREARRGSSDSGLEL